MKAALLIDHDHRYLMSFGHSLKTCLDEMLSRFPSHKSQYDEHRDVVHILDQSYSAKEFEYRITGAARWPVPSELLYATEEFCLLSDKILRSQAV
jgi:hypothetical protein